MKELITIVVILFFVFILGHFLGWTNRDVDWSTHKVTTCTNITVTTSALTGVTYKTNVWNELSPIKLNP